MKIAYVRWKDAVSEEAAEPNTAVTAQLCVLDEIGFLLAESDDAICIGMEYQGDDKVRPGRYRLHIPKVSIVDMRVIDLDTVLAKRKRKISNAT